MSDELSVAQRFLYGHLKDVSLPWQRRVYQYPRPLRNGGDAPCFITWLFRSDAPSYAGRKRKSSTTLRYLITAHTFDGVDAADVPDVAGLAALLDTKLITPGAPLPYDGYGVSCTKGPVYVGPAEQVEGGTYRRQGAYYDVFISFPADA